MSQYVPHKQHLGIKMDSRDQAVFVTPDIEDVKIDRLAVANHRDHIDTAKRLL